MDGDGNMALGFSTSSASLFPAIRYVGRLAGDPLGTLPQSEAVLIAGSGAQTSSSSRWGDYSGKLRQHHYDEHQGAVYVQPPQSGDVHRDTRQSGVQLYPTESGSDTDQQEDQCELYRNLPVAEGNGGRGTRQRDDFVSSQYLMSRWHAQGPESPKPAPPPSPSPSEGEGNGWGGTFKAMTDGAVIARSEATWQSHSAGWARMRLLRFRLAMTMQQFVLRSD